MRRVIDNGPHRAGNGSRTMTTVSRPHDRALVGILGGNAATLLAALVFEWGLVQLLWPFWIQSMIIGWYARQRIRKLDAFCVEGVQFNHRPMENGETAKHRVANFFTMHFGFFHLVYLVFLLIFTTTSSTAGFIDVKNENSGEIMAVHMGNVTAFDWLIFAIIGLMFWRVHRASHEEHVAADLAGKPNIGTLMMVPYARVIPMHLTIILGVWLGGGAMGNILFMALKTGADVVMHRYEHRKLQTSVAIG